MNIRRLPLLWSVILSMLLLSLSACPNSSGNVQPPPPVDRSKDRPSDLEHRISYSGETLAIIANWYTGKSTNWTAIREANPGLRPERLNIGQVVMIPGELVIERNPLPRRALGGSSKKSTKSVPADVKVDDTVPATPPDEVPTDPVPDSPPTDVAPPTDTADPNTVDLEQLLKEQIEAQKKNAGTAPTQAPEPSEPEPEKAPDKAPTVPGDSEREQLLDELLTQ